MKPIKTISGEMYLPNAIIATRGGEAFAQWLDQNHLGKLADALRSGVSVTVKNISNKNWAIIRDAIHANRAWPVPEYVNGKIVEDDNRPYFRYMSTVPE